MLSLPGTQRELVSLSPVNFRKAHDGLVAIVSDGWLTCEETAADASFVQTRSIESGQECIPPSGRSGSDQEVLRSHGVCRQDRQCQKREGKDFVVYEFTAFIEHGEC